MITSGVTSHVGFRGAVRTLTESARRAGAPMSVCVFVDTLAVMSDHGGSSLPGILQGDGLISPTFAMQSTQEARRLNPDGVSVRRSPRNKDFFV